MLRSARHMITAPSTAAMTNPATSASSAHLNYRAVTYVIWHRTCNHPCRTTADRARTGFDRIRVETLELDPPVACVLAANPANPTNPANPADPDDEPR